jgi:phage major head subunit gpT-like protein
MGIIVNTNIRRASNLTLFKAIEESVSMQPWKNASLVHPMQSATDYFEWLGEFPGVSEFIDKRKIYGLRKHDFSITAKKWESTLGIKGDDLKDNGELIRPRLQGLGMDVAAHPNKLFFDFLKAGDGAQAGGGAKASYPWAGCYDTQTFFSNSHPIYDPTGTATTNDNIVGGTGVDTVAHIQADFDSAMQQFYNLRKRDGSPLFDDIGNDFTIYCASEDVALFNQAFLYPTYVATALPNPYFNRAKVIATAHLNSNTPYDVNGHAATYTQGSWFILLGSRPLKPLIYAELEPVTPEWDLSEQFMADMAYYGVKMRYNFGYGLWQFMQKVYNA